MERAGAIRNAAYFHTEFGWVHAPRRDDVYGYSLRREVLDPMLRKLAADTPGVELHLGLTAAELDRGLETSTLVATDRAGGRHEFRARLIVGADGRRAKTAELAGFVARPSTNGRFGYFAHFRNVELFSGTDAVMWFDLPDVAYAFPNDDGVVVMTVMPAMDKLPRYKEDLERAFYGTFERLPLAPDLSRAERASKFIGTHDLTNRRRTVSDDQVALIGDAAMTSDPLWGIGCGWAFQSAEWLVDETASALAHGKDLGAAMARYRRVHLRKLGGHNFLINDFAKARQFNRLERLLWNGAVWDPQVAQHMEDFGTRMIGPRKLLSPRMLFRAAKATRGARRATPPAPLAVIATSSNNQATPAA